MTKLILACDVTDPVLGQALMEETAAHVDIIKVGLEAMTAEDGDCRSVAALLRRHARAIGKPVMWDMKLHDIGATMERASQNIARLGSGFFTIHSQASDRALAFAARAAEEAGFSSMPLAVTVLTDLDDGQCYTRFHASSDLAVRHFAENARRLGVCGFVCSPREAATVRRAVPDAYIVTPGIRPAWAADKNDQKRVATPAEAKRAGADAIVVGRPICRPPDGRTPESAAREIREELDAA